MFISNPIQAACPIDQSRLTTVTFKYYDFSGNVHNDGQIVVLDIVGEHVTEIFAELYTLKFPIHKSQATEFYSGDDTKSMADNNSSSYNCREATGKPGIYSIHSYGLAIDINPIQNPYVGIFNKENSTATVLPSEGLAYLNRANLRPGMVEPVVHIFRKHGFSVWGGDWDDRIDYQHFQTVRVVAELLAIMPKDEAMQFFMQYVQNPALLNKIPDDDKELLVLYTKSPEEFRIILKEKFGL